MEVEITKCNLNVTIWFVGDLILPDIVWERDMVANHQYSIALNECDISYFDYVSLIKWLISLPVVIMYSTCFPVTG